MLVIRRATDRHRAYTAIFLKGEPARMFPTTDYEHTRILQIYKQDRPCEDVLNDFTDYTLGKSGAEASRPTHFKEAAKPSFWRISQEPGAL